MARVQRQETYRYYPVAGFRHVWAQIGESPTPLAVRETRRRQSSEYGTTESRLTSDWHSLPPFARTGIESSHDSVVPVHDRDTVWEGRAVSFLYAYRTVGDQLI
jgi:hypothetical protein